MVYLITTFSPAMITGLVESHIKEVHEAFAVDFLLNREFVSNVGHEITARYLSIRWGAEIMFNRKAIKFKAGDTAICVLPAETLKKIEEVSEARIKNTRFRFFLISSDARTDIWSGEI